MSIRSALSTLFAAPAEAAQTDKRNEVATSFFSSKRLLVIVAFGALIALNMLPASLIHDVTLVVIAYIIGESITKTATVIMNGLIKANEVRTDVDYTRMEKEAK